MKDSRLTASKTKNYNEEQQIDSQQNKKITMKDTILTASKTNITMKDTRLTDMKTKITMTDSRLTARKIVTIPDKNYNEGQQIDSQENRDGILPSGDFLICNLEWQAYPWKEQSEYSYILRQWYDI